MTQLASVLSKGDEVRVIAPSNSLDPNDSDKRQVIIDGFISLGLTVSFSQHCFNTSASRRDKVDDLHQAFVDNKVQAIFAGTGGFSANDLVNYIDYKLIKKYPKILIGYSDITVLLNAIHARTGLITYHGANAGGVGDDHGREFVHDYLKKGLFSRQVFELAPSSRWFDKDYTATNPRYRSFKNDGWWNLNPKGIVEGRLVGGNLSSLLLLAGTKYSPNLKGSILLIEDDYETQAYHFAAKLRAVMQQPGFNRVEGIIIGRFQPRSHISEQFLRNLITENAALEQLPIIGNIDAGHTKPQVVLPIGGIVQVAALKSRQCIKVIEH